MYLQAIHENCSGCGVCRLICAIENFREVNPSMALLKIEGRFPAPGDYRIHVCDQCGQCAQVCPVEAIFVENGIYILDKSECTACMACVEACPHGVLMAHPRLETPAKCNLCGQCVELCPRRALVIVDHE